MIGRILLILLALSLWTPQENMNFFVENGEPQCLVVYGENSVDFESAKIIAEKIAEKAKKQEKIFTFTQKNYVDKNNGQTPHCDFIAVGNTSGYFNKRPYINLPLWYDDTNLNGKLDKNESREEIQIQFSTHNNNFPVLSMGDIRYRTVIEELPLKRLWKSGEKSVYIYDTPEKVRFLQQELSPLDYFESLEGNILLLGEPYRKTFPLQEEVSFQGWKVQMGEQYTITEPNGKSHTLTPDNLVYIKRTVCEAEDTAIFAMRVGESNVEVYVLRNYSLVRDATGVQIGADRWNFYVRSEDIEYIDFEDYSPSFRDNNIEYIVGLRNYSPVSGSVSLTEFQIPPCGLLEEESYTGRIFFALETEDTDPRDTTVDNVKMTYKKVEEESFLKYIIKDTELTNQIVRSYNLITVGGPGYTKTEKGTNICNTWTKSIVDEELSEVNWYTSEGEWEYIEERGTLIVAGKDREATRKAAEKLVEQL